MIASLPALFIGGPLPAAFGATSDQLTKGILPGSHLTLTERQRGNALSDAAMDHCQLPEKDPLTKKGNWTENDNTMITFSVSDQLKIMNWV